MALRDAMLREVHRSVPKADALELSEVRAYYDAHAAYYAEPERRRLQAIVVSSEGEAKRAVSALGTTPTAARFGEVVKARSSDASAKTGAPLDLLGDVGFASAPGDDRGSNARIPEPVRKAAHTLAGVGAVSEPIAVGSTYWIVRVTSVSASRARSFEEVEKTIRIALAQDKRLAAEKAKLAELAKAAKIEVDPSALEAVFKAGATP
jgi:parvulin-like peptidyl-prolyl isomerase